MDLWISGRIVIWTWTRLHVLPGPQTPPTLIGWPWRYQISVFSKCLITPIFLVNDFLSLWFFWKDQENYFHIYLLTARRSSQSFLKEINPEYSLEGLMLKLQWSPEEPTHWKRPWCWERFKAGGEGDDRGLDGWMSSLTQWTWPWASSGRW